MQTNMQS